MILSFAEWLIDLIKSDVMHASLLDLLTHITDAIYIEDANGRIIFCNPAAEQLYGYSIPEILNSEAGILIPAEVLADNRAMLQRFADESVKSIAGVTKRKTRDGQEIEIDLTMVRFSAGPDYQGLTAHIVAKDITLSAESWGLSMAHELRAPLSVLTSLTLLLESEVKKRHIELMKKQLSIADSIIRNMVAFLSTQKPEVQKVNVGDLFNEIREQLALPETGPLNAASPAGLHCSADPFQIRQALVDLVRNAIEALEGKSGNIYLTACEESEWVKIQVIDSGPGIADQIQSRLFEPFLTTKEKGLGLGLATARRLIRSNSGRIFAESSSQGTVFTVLLPKCDHT